jgi:hypothetical protein
VCRLRGVRLSRRRPAPSVGIIERPRRMTSRRRVWVSATVCSLWRHDGGPAKP